MRLLIDREGQQHRKIVSKKQKYQKKKEMANLGGFVSARVGDVGRQRVPAYRGGVQQPGLAILIAPPCGLSTPRAPKQLLPKFQKINLVTE